VIVHGFDITSRRRVEDELHASEERLKLALSAANGVGTWDWDIPQDRVYADAAFSRLYGIEQAALQPDTGESREGFPPGHVIGRGRPIADFSRNIHVEDRGRIDQAIQEAVHTGEEYVSEYRVVQADGSVRWVAARGRCTHAPDGTPLRFAGVVIDITDRKQSEDALRQAEKLAAVGRLASSIAHEINNPLESVVNLLYLIEHTEDHAAVRAYAQIAQEELARVSQIATQTLRFFKQSTHPTMTDIGEVLQSVLALYRGRLQNSGIKVQLCARRVRGRSGGPGENQVRTARWRCCVVKASCGRC
jgi:signal transduction histidine kinase